MPIDSEDYRLGSDCDVPFDVYENVNMILFNHAYCQFYIFT